MRGSARFGLGGLLVLLVSGCSVSIGDEPIGERVASELEDRGPELLDDEDVDLEFVCDEPGAEVEGTTFECRSSGGPGDVRWQIVLEGEGAFDAVTVNLVSADGLDDLRGLVADQATRMSGTEVTSDDVACGQGPVVLDPDLTLTCVVTVPGLEAPVEAEVAFTDITEPDQDRTDLDSIVIDELGLIGTAAASAAGVEVIETEAVALGLGEVIVTCEEPADEEAGTSFVCTSASSLGLVEWVATITEVGRVSASSTNLIRAEAAEPVERTAVETLEAEVGAPLGLENFDCGPGPFVLDADLSMVCALTQPTSGEVYDATLTFTDLETGAFRIRVATEPRS